MAKIHWIVYIVVGLFVSIMSWRLGYEKLFIFFYAGIIFVLAGIIKAVIDAKRKKKNEALSKIFKADAKEKPSQPLRYCLKCGDMVRAIEGKCPKCGTVVVVHGM